MLTERDEEIVQTLCLNVRLMSLPQVARVWWSGTRAPEEAARRRLGKLIEAGQVQHTRVIAAQLPAMKEPVGTWRPGEGTPDFGGWAWKLQSRWEHAPRSINVYWATRAAAGAFGGRGRGRLKQPHQATHDLGVAEMYLNLRVNNPDLAAQWIGEDRLQAHRPKQKVPDAVLAAGPAARPQLVLEFGGAYDKARVRAFHEDCRRRKLPYELW